jgi:restriction system protein
MSANETIIWGIHAGKTGDAQNLFLKKELIGLGWPEMGDLTQLKPDRESFKAKMILAYPNSKPGAVPVNAGQLFRFVYELKVGDIVIYPSKIDSLVHIGKVEGTYKFEPSVDINYPNLRVIKWIKAIPRIGFTQGALNEIGSEMSFFQVKNYADEFVSALESNKVPIPPKVDETIAVIADDIVQTTRDYILKQLSREMKGHPLEHFVGHLLETMGYRTRITPVGTDSGVDIIAHKDELGFEPPIIKVQVKSGDGTVGDPVVSALYGKVGTGEFGLIITLSTFTNQAKTFARNKTNLRLIDGEELVNLILEHYEQFDSRYKGLMPMKRVYIPEALKDSEG